MMIGACNPMLGADSPLPIQAPAARPPPGLAAMPQPKPQQPVQQQTPVPIVQQQQQQQQGRPQQGEKTKRQPRKKKMAAAAKEIPGMPMPAGIPAPDTAQQPADAALGSNTDTPILEHLQHAQGQRVLQQKLHNESVKVCLLPTSAPPPPPAPPLPPAPLCPLPTVRGSDHASPPPRSPATVLTPPRPGTLPRCGAFFLSFFLSFFFFLFLSFFRSTPKCGNRRSCSRICRCG